MKNKYVALVPARSGSEGLPGKNVLEIGEQSLLQLAVKCAEDLQCINQIFVSSDSPDYLKSVTSKNPKVKLLLRDERASTRTATASDVVLHLLSSAELNDEDFIIYLQPTSPLRTAEHLRMAISLLESSNETSLISVVEASQHPLKSIQIVEGRVKVAAASAPTANRQALPSAYFPNGAIYIFQVRLFRDIKDIPVEHALAFEMSKRDSLDVDDKLDYLIAKYLVEKNVF